jgi:hypothetical protein
VTTREKAQKLLDETPEDELEPVVEILASRGTNSAGLEAAGDPVTELDELEIAALPKGWGETLTGEPMPNVVSAVRRSRESH